MSEIFNRSIDIPAITEQPTSTRRWACSSSSSACDLPDDFGQIKVFESDALPAAQAAIATMDKVVYALVALTILLAIVAFVLSTRRLRTALWLGFGVAIGLIVVRRLALRLDDAIVARVTGETNQAAVGAVTSDVFQDLRNFTTLMLVAAILIGVGAYLAGRPPWLTRTLERASDGTLVPRDAGWIRWIGEHGLVLRVIAVALGALVLFFANLGWMSLLVVMALVAAAWFVLTYLHERVTGQADVATGERPTDAGALVRSRTRQARPPAPLGARGLGEADRCAGRSPPDRCGVPGGQPRSARRRGTPRERRRVPRLPLDRAARRGRRLGVRLLLRSRPVGGRGSRRRPRRHRLHHGVGESGSRDVGSRPVARLVSSV